MALVDDVATRLAAIVAGTYPPNPGVGDRAIPEGTFKIGQVFLPSQNNLFPRTAVVTRTCDLVIYPPTFDRASPLAVNTRDPVWYREMGADVRVQYVVENPTALAPRDRELVLGAVTAASRRAAGDSMLLEWALLWRRNWDTVALGARLRAAPVAPKVDTLRVVLTFPILLTLRQDATASPGVTA